MIVFVEGQLASYCLYTIYTYKLSSMKGIDDCIL
jgi:hypothetical protein